MTKTYISGSCKAAVFSSKLFQASSRKDKIIAAMENPINAELIKQLDEYIGDEYKPKANTDESDTIVESEPAEDEWGFEDDNDSSAPQSHDGGPSLSEKYGDALNAEGEEKFEATQISDSDDEAEKSAESSTKVQKTSIQADTVVTKPFVENHVTLNGLAGELKGTLNARASTAGVVRVSVKNDEVWIYYNDDTNLNNVMSAVIEILNAANYQYLIFNRLARTDNAIVFTINSNDTLNGMEHMSNEK